MSQSLQLSDREIWCLSRFGWSRCHLLLIRRHQIPSPCCQFCMSVVLGGPIFRFFFLSCQVLSENLVSRLAILVSGWTEGDDDVFWSPAYFLPVVRWDLSCPSSKERSVYIDPSLSVVHRLGAPCEQSDWFSLHVGAWILLDVEVVKIWVVVAAGNRQATNCKYFWLPARGYKIEHLGQASLSTADSSFEKYLWVSSSHKLQANFFKYGKP